MTEPTLAPRNAVVGVLAVWAVALVGAILVGILAPEASRIAWLLVSFGGVVLLSFATQLWYGRTDGFILRVAGSTLGSLLLMGAISVGFALTSLLR